MIFLNKNTKLRNQGKISILALFIILSTTSIFINSGFPKEFTELQIQTPQFPSENIKTINGLGISQFYTCEENAQICSDGTGGAIITWEDDRGGVCDIYAQRINST